MCLVHVNLKFEDKKKTKIIPQSNPSPMVLSFFVHLMSKTSTFIAHTFQQFNSEHYNVQDTNALNRLCTKIQSDIFSPNWPLKWVIMSFAGRMSRYDVDDFSRTRYGVWRWKLLSYCVLLCVLERLLSCFALLTLIRNSATSLWHNSSLLESIAVRC